MAYIDVTDATFDEDVLERSTQAAVVVDLWASWCGPCRTLGPIIERVVDATQGRVVLAKVNVDENPRISATFRVQSIPAVYALKDRLVVDQFIGAIPEAQVQAWVDRLVPPVSEADRLVALGDEASLRRATELEPGNERALCGLAELLVEKGGRVEAEEALLLLGRIPETAETRRIAAMARVGAEAVGHGHDTANELAALLGSVKADETVRQRYLDLLELISDDAVKSEYRRKLAAALF